MLALPHPSTDISATCPQLEKLLNEHTLNPLPSETTPQTVNGHKCNHWASYCTCNFTVMWRDHSEDIHINPGMSGGIMSWKTTTKGLNILPAHCLDTVEDTDTTVKSAVPKIVDINVVITAAYTERKD